MQKLKFDVEVELIVLKYKRQLTKFKENHILKECHAKKFVKKI